ncbi:acetolactate synthase large subunit [Embleya hyalina]|uniref:Acetolactate synthase I/II/III large subunit n=1 Tax=Embleya hyalina TaxID=516124 RepID=A0A401YED1_9ACTN|nr:acetolactate synthase large subunit [Embleya hyalina]GCD92971.1 acetolactate synthase I/II/III large subunit [Embleya hyalina]
MQTMPGTTGAHALVRTLVDSDVRVCFANPGTSEMHFVAALDTLPQMRGVLCLFEGVATGAADGYGRMTGHPAATLLHLGPGLANGLANLHNARRANTPVVNVVGDHALGHKALDSLLESNIDALAGTVSGWVRRSASIEDLGTDAAEAVAATLTSGAAGEGGRDPSRNGTSGSVSTLIVPADLSWSTGGRSARPVKIPAPAAPSEQHVRSIAKLLRSGESCVLLLDGPALSEQGLRAASRIERATGARLLARNWAARQRRGAGVPHVEPLAYRGEQITAQLRDAHHLILCGARTPVTSFAYPDRSSLPTPPDTRVHVLAEDEGADTVLALDMLADHVAPHTEPLLAPSAPPPLPRGALTVDNWAAVIGALLPEEAIVCDESITAGMATLHAATAGSPPHDVLGLTGLSIGQGLPSATGAAIACPDRPVICLQADGSAMYTLSALWSHAREHLDITTVILNNSSYAILRAELERVGATAEASAQLFDLSRPDLDFVSLAHGMGVPAERAGTAEDLARQFRRALSEPGPHLIEAVLLPHGG